MVLVLGEARRDVILGKLDLCCGDAACRRFFASIVASVRDGLDRRCAVADHRPVRSPAAPPAPVARLGVFSVDVTIPLNHRCMGVLPIKSRRVADPLYAKGWVLLPADQTPIVFCSVDWCEIRNGAYDAWRDALASATGTSRARVLVNANHQHDAPVVDLDAAAPLATVGLKGELFDETFHRDVLRRVAEAARNAVEAARPVTHLALGAAKVEQVASNRRVVLANGGVAFSRGSRSGGDAFFRDADDGLIDPWVRTLGFYNEDHPLAAIHVYATHPMSVYGQGVVSSDFVGLARDRLQREEPNVAHIYCSGCSGDVTAGRFNDGSEGARQDLIDRMHRALRESWRSARRIALQDIRFRKTLLQLPFHPKDELQPDQLVAVLRDESKSPEDRILAAMGLASRRRVAAGRAIDVPLVDLGAASILLLPGESFVGYQLQAQELASEKHLLTIGYGECWPGYIPTQRAFAEGFDDKWLWVGPEAPAAMQRALAAFVRSVRRLRLRRHFRCLSSQSKNTRCQSTPFCGDITQWPSLG